MALCDVHHVKIAGIQLKLAIGDSSQQAKKVLLFFPPSQVSNDDDGDGGRVFASDFRLCMSGFLSFPHPLFTTPETTSELSSESKKKGVDKFRYSC